MDVSWLAWFLLEDINRDPRDGIFSLLITRKRKRTENPHGQMLRLSRCAVGFANQKCIPSGPLYNDNREDFSNQSAEALRLADSKDTAQTQMFHVLTFALRADGRSNG